MIRHCLLIAASSLLILPALVRANTDPDIGVLGGDPTCTPVNVTSINPTVQPNGTNCFVITNNSGAVINSLDFDMTINSGLIEQGVNVVGPGGTPVFTISQLDNGYFLHTSLTYNDGNGDLNFKFFGINNADGDETCGLPGSPANCEIGEREGIPVNGVFTIELTGWVNSLTVNDPTQIYNNEPSVTSNFTTVPEPSTSFALAIAFLLIAGLAEFRRRRSGASARF